MLFVLIDPQNCHKYYDDPTAYAVCAQHACICEVGKDDFYRETCGIGEEGSLCFDEARLGVESWRYGFVSI